MLGAWELINTVILSELNAFYRVPYRLRVKIRPLRKASETNRNFWSQLYTCVSSVSYKKSIKTRVAEISLRWTDPIAAPFQVDKLIP